MRRRVRCRTGSGIGAADRSAWVYGCLGSVKRLVPIRHLDQHAEVHDRDPLGQVLHRGQVVGDEQAGEAELGLQPADQVEHRGLHGHVERGRRLVGHQQRRAGRQRPGQADPLSLPAGELVRVATPDLGAQADLVEQLIDPRWPGCRGSRSGAAAAVRRRCRPPSCAG